MMKNKMIKLLIETPYIAVFFSILYPFIIGKGLAFCDWTDWNPGKYLISDPVIIEEASKNVDEGVVSYPEFIKEIADLLLDTTINTDNIPTETNDNEYISIGETSRSILEDYKKILSSHPNTKENIVDKSMEFVHQTIPNYLWNQNVKDLENENNPLVNYIDLFSAEIDIDDENNLKALISYRTAVLIYNDMVISKIDYMANRDEMVEKFYKALVQESLQFYQ